MAKHTLCHTRMEAFYILSLLSFYLLPSGFSHENSFDAIYQFGDSISDVGNAIRESASGMCSGCGLPPYGQTFSKEPTGRCSDGLLIVDYIAQALKLPLLSPYDDKQGNFCNGANFAVAGATALNASTLAAKNFPRPPSSLLPQFDNFQSHLTTICQNPAECKEKLGRALFLVGEIGGNDYNGAAWAGKPMEELRALVPEVVQTIIQVVNNVIGLGGKRIIVPGNFPIGCMTIYLARFKTNDPTKYDEIKCLKEWNDFSAFHNDNLQQALNGIQANNPSVSIVYIDYFSALTSLLKNAASLGFDTNKLFAACCGAGGGEYNFDSSNMCGTGKSSACPQPDKHVSWDGIHLTQHAYQVIAQAILPKILPTKQ